MRRIRDIPEAVAGSARRDWHSARPTIRVMDIEMLIEEIFRYLVAVEALGEAGYEPRWRS